jgi:hypothetical protein
LKDGKTEELKRIYNQMVKHGLHNCLLPFAQVISDEIMKDTLSGKRVLMLDLSTFKTFLTNRVKQKGQCGFYLSESVVDYMPLFMLFNKKFNKKLKDKIDFR